MAGLETELHCFKCNRIDFLPISCIYCRQLFCADHSNTDNHECTNLSVQKSVEATEINTKIGKQKCAMEHCNVVDILTHKCEYCQQVYCLKHRHSGDHTCVSSNLQQPPIKQSEPKLFKFKAAKYNPKIELMRLKLNAKGTNSIPTNQRFYCNLMVNEQQYPVFLNSFLVIGKVLDQLAREYGLVNNNNKQGGGQLRIVVLGVEKEQVLPMNETIKDLVASKIIENGARLALINQSNNVNS